jgi:CheY-like chemotaxis protein
MPLVDGIQCTRMIRRHEKSNEDLRAMRQRVPIIAVSASLIEKNRFDYIDDG